MDYSFKVFNREFIEILSSIIEAWEKEKIEEGYRDRKKSFETESGIPIKNVYTPLDISDQDYIQQLGMPGQYPFTRGIHYNMYRGRVWTMREFSGFGTPEDTNRRFKYLIEHGETGLSIAFDFPTLLGIDPDDPRAYGEVGVVGVSVPTLNDMEVIFNGINMGEVTTNMTINPPAPVMLSFYVATARSQGVPDEKIGGTTQNDQLKEFIAQKSWVFPPQPALKIGVDLIEWSIKNLPKWNPISISGYHIYEAGATAVEELALTLADGIEYVREMIRRGYKVDDFAHRLSFFFASGVQVFEHVAKFRAARRMWAKIMKEWFGATKKRSMWLRFHTQTSGVELTALEPYNNIIRVTLQALAAVLGGTQSLHTNAFDEALALPTEFSAKIALRTQQILAYESGIADTVDPLGGSYYIEWLTDRIEEEAWKIIYKIEEMGGMINAIEKGYPQSLITESAYRKQKSIEEMRKIVVGVNAFKGEILEEEKRIPLLKIDEEKVREQQIQRVRRVRSERDPAKWRSSLLELERAAMRGENIMPYVYNAAISRATLGEIMGTLREIYGEWSEPIYL
ncbi:MAG: methylmalonyl-CoA mutase family protein [Sulfolobales archaeon]